MPTGKGHDERIRALYNLIREDEDSIALSAMIGNQLISVTWDELIDLLDEIEDQWNALVNEHGRQEAFHMVSKQKLEREAYNNASS